MDIEVGGSVSCAVLDGGGVQCWGRGSNLGRNATQNSSTPLSVLLDAETGGELAGASRLVSTVNAMCALLAPTDARSLWCWAGSFAAPYVASSAMVQHVHVVERSATANFLAFVDSNGVYQASNYPAAPAFACE